MKNSILSDPDYVRYWNDIQKYPVLSREEETKLAFQARDGDKQAASRLVTAHLRFVVKVAVQYSHGSARLLDLIQEGTVGLIKAVEKFDPERGHRLLTYAVHWIRAYIRLHLEQQQSVVRHPSRVSSGPTEEGAPSRPRRKSVLRDVSLSQPAHGEDDGPDMESLLHDDTLPTLEDQCIEQEVDLHLKKAIGGALDRLAEREQTILRQRYLEDDQATLQDLGSSLGISRERVRQLEARAMSRVAKSLLRSSSEIVREAYTTA